MARENSKITLRLSEDEAKWISKALSLVIAHDRKISGGSDKWLNNEETDFLSGVSWKLLKQSGALNYE